METVHCPSDRADGESTARAEFDAYSRGALTLDTVQVNLGLRCNMACTHCHQSSSPTRTERMSDGVLAQVVEFVRLARPELVDITGGAPELHPGLRWLLSQLADLGVDAQIRTNLTVLGTKDAADLPEYFAAHQTWVLASLPSVDPEAYGAVRGHSFDAAIEGLRRLNRVGYGTDPALRLDLAVNVERALQPHLARAADLSLRCALADSYGVSFSQVIRIVDMPLGRLGDRLSREEAVQARLEAAAADFNPQTLVSLSCRHGLEIAWDGRLSDCDFNLAAGLGLAAGLPPTVGEVLAAGDAETLDRTLEGLRRRRINYGAHCAICTAGAGSS